MGQVFGVEGQCFEGLVEGEGIDIPVEMLALEIDFEAGRHLLWWRVDVALGRVLGRLQFRALQYALEVEIAGQVEEIALLGGHVVPLCATSW